MSNDQVSHGLGWGVVVVAAGLCCGLPVLLGASVAAGVLWVGGLAIPAAVLVGAAIWLVVRRARARQGCPAPRRDAREVVDCEKSKERV